MFSILKAGVLSLALGLGAQAARAATLATYSFDGANGLAGTASDPDLIAADALAGAFTGGATGNYGLSGSGGVNNTKNFFARGKVGGATQLHTAEALAVSSADYVEFTLGPVSGGVLSLSSFSAQVGGQILGTQSTDVAATTPTFFLRSSLDGFAADLGSASVSVPLLPANGASGASVFTNLTVDLSGAAFQNLTSPVTFRLYMYLPTTSLNANQLVRIDDVAFDGAASVPEPRLSAFLILGGLLLVAPLRGFRAARA